MSCNPASPQKRTWEPAPVNVNNKPNVSCIAYSSVRFGSNSFLTSNNFAGLVANRRKSRTQTVGGTLVSVVGGSCGGRCGAGGGGFICGGSAATASSVGKSYRIICTANP